MRKNQNIMERLKYSCQFPHFGLAGDIGGLALSKKIKVSSGRVQKSKKIKLELAVYICSFYSRSLADLEEFLSLDLTVL